MRSKIGTKTRLAAHIMALFLLIVILTHGNSDVSGPTPRNQLPGSGVSLPPPAKAEASIRPIIPGIGAVNGTLDRIHIPAGAEANAPGELRPPGEAPAGAEPVESVAPVEPSPEPEAIPEPPADEPIVFIETETVPESVSPAISSEPVAEPMAEPAIEPAETPAEPIREGEDAPIPAEPESTPISPVESAEPAAPQPDESGSLVVAAPETGSDLPVPATAPLPGNANLAVLGDGVYWLDSRYDLEKELAAIPEIGSLVFLAPVPEYRPTGFEHVKTEVIAADLADISGDAAEQYLQAVAGDTRPTVTAVLPGARGAAFFKGVYLLANRRLDMAEIIRELEPELEESGAARDDIIHRLMRFQGR